MKYDLNQSFDRITVTKKNQEVDETYTYSLIKGTITSKTHIYINQGITQTDRYSFIWDKNILVKQKAETI